MAAQMEVERLANFQVECVGMISSRTHGKRTRNWVNASEYSIGVFLAEEVVPQSRQGRQVAAARSTRVPSRGGLPQGASSRRR